MTKDELDQLVADGKTFDDVIYDFEEDNDCIVSRDVILDYAIYQIQNDRLYLARHILDAVDTDYADWYNYDASMGMLETPTPVDEVNDLYDYVED